jgi:hypothetical protein
MTNAACMTDDDFEVAALRQSSERWLLWLNAELLRRGDTPRSRLLGLWDALEDWFTTEEFATSLLASGAMELRSDPDHPAHAVIAAHRQGLRQLLEDLAKAAWAYDTAILAAQLQVLVDGAIAAAAVDRDPAAARGARDLARAAMTAAADTA